MKSANFQFQINPDVIKLGVRGIYLAITGLQNKDTDDDFESYKVSVLKDLVKEYGSNILEKDPILTGFRELHTKVGRSNRKYVSAPEVLISRFLRTKTFPHINLVVDIYNLVSLKTRLALGAHDISKIDGNISLKLTTGDESYLPLGATSKEQIFPGEYCYVDNNDVICRMEVLQVEKTKVDLTSKDCFYIIQGNENTPEDYLKLATRELIDLVKKYCGGEPRILYS